MQKKTFKVVKALSLFFSFLHFGGLFWFLPDYITPISYFLFTLSPGLALLVVPLITDKMLQWIVVRVGAVIIGIAGITNNIYMMTGDLSLQNYPDIPAFIGRIIVMLMLMITTFRIINPEFVIDKEVDKIKAEKCQITI